MSVQTESENLIGIGCLNCRDGWLIRLPIVAYRFKSEKNYPSDAKKQKSKNKEPVKPPHPFEKPALFHFILMVPPIGSVKKNFPLFVDIRPDRLAALERPVKLLL